MRIGVISDTHGKIHPRIREVFNGVDHILHAGDIGGEKILEELETIAPVTAAAGNVDGFSCGNAGEFASIELGGTTFLVTHILDRPHLSTAACREMIERMQPQVVIFGHSHLPHDEVVDGIRYFNPASAGPRRFDLPTSVGLFELLDGKWRSTHIPLDARSHDALLKYMNQLSRPA